MAKPDYKQIMVTEPGGKLRPLDPVSEIIPGLWQGIRPASYRDYDLVVSCEQFLAKGPMESYDGMVIHIPMRDDDEFKVPNAAIQAAAHAMVVIISDGGKILVHCSGGLNRSSLVTIRFLILCESMLPADAVTLLRAKRDQFCLCNKAFERWVLGEQLPTAETSTFRLESPASVEALLDEEDFAVLNKEN